MRYGSVCSGIEAATVAWHGLGWEPAFFSEIDPFPRAVLSHHYPDVPLHGDFTTIEAGQYADIDVLVGGTPCQSFSIAGLRLGVADPRGFLALEFIRLVERLRPTWCLWENVSGVLSLDKGRAFGSFLGGLAHIGYGFAYRVLDAQFYGVPQRRRRVFVVGHRDWRCAGAVLFDAASCSWSAAPGEGSRQADPAADASRITGHGGHIAGTVSAKWEKGTGGPAGDECQNLIVQDGVVRRLTPTECERLQGFPDDYTLIPYRNKPASDGPRYKALGNSMAVPVMRWIGERIAMIEELTHAAA